MNRILGIIGCGNMGQAILKGMLGSSFIKPDSMVFFEKNMVKASGIEKNYGIRQARDIQHMAGICRYILLAVKPQDIVEVLDSLQPGIDPEKTSLLSLAAGISTGYIRRKLKKNVSVVRIMPNAPALYCSGMSTISRGTYATEEDMKFAREMMGSVGEYAVIEERLQDISTALNGSGPAYFFLFCRCLIEAGIKNGLEPETARKLVVKTMIGSGMTLEKSGDDIYRLISMVASPGGTTERALSEFRKGHLEEIVDNAVREARDRARELEKILEQDIIPG